MSPTWKPPIDEGYVFCLLSITVDWQIGRLIPDGREVIRTSRYSQAGPGVCRELHELIHSQVLWPLLLLLCCCLQGSREIMYRIGEESYVEEGEGSILQFRGLKAL